MKFSPTLIFVFTFFVACNSKKTVPIVVTETAASNAQTTIEDTASNFFPVTSYLRGEIYGIRNGGITPSRKITIGDKTDSSWVKMEALEKVLSEFLSPIIDTSNLKGLFEEKKFKDETLNAFTFTYDPKDIQSNTFAFKHWDVYVDPETNKVKRIYLLKKETEGKVLQLTWQSGKWCKIVTLKDTGNNNLVIEKEEKISWSFD